MLGVLAQIKADKESVESLVQPVEAADRLFQEIQTWQKQVIDLEYMLDSRGQGVRSMEDIQLELNSLESTKYVILTITVTIILDFHIFVLFCLLQVSVLLKLINNFFQKKINE